MEQRTMILLTSPRYLSKRTLWLFIFSILLSALWLGHSKSAAAITNVSPAVGTSNGPGTQPWLAVGTGAFNGQTTYVKIYVPNGQASSITVNQGCGLDVGSPRVTYAIYTLTNDDTWFGTPVDVAASSGGCSGSLSMNIPASGGFTSTITGHQGFRTYYFEAQISAAPGDNERNFRVSASGGSLVGISRPVKFSGQAATFGIYQRDASAQGMWNYNQRFAPRCSDANGGYGIGVFDADYSVYSPQDLRLVVAEADRGTTAFAGIKQWSTSAELGENGDYRILSFSAQNNKTYRMQWSGINWRNTLQIYVPFDEFDVRLNNTDCTPNPPGGAVCNAAVASVNPVLINQNSQFTVNVKNNSTTTTWDSSYSLRQTYYSNINPARQTLTRALASGPGLLGPGQNGNFVFNISRAAPGTFTFEFQMQQNGNLVGSFNPNCRIVLTVTANPPPRPECYIRFVVGGVDRANNAPITVPYGTGVTIRAQILNDTAKAWGPNYYMAENINNTTGFQNIGNLTSTGPGAFTRVFERTFPSVQGQTTWEYEIWLPGGPADHGGGRRVICPITAYVALPVVQGSIGGSLGADCKRIGYEVHWQPASSNPIRTIIRTMSGGQHDRDVTAAPGTYSFDPFTDPAFNTVPIDQQVNYELFALDSDGTWVSRGSVTIGPCMTYTCSPAPDIDIEPNETTNISNLGGFIINNSTNRNDPLTVNTSVTGASVAYPNPYNFSSSSGPHVVPASTITATTSTITISRTLSYRGAVVNSCSEQSIPKSRPYLKVFGGDVSTGGWFNNGNASCSGNANVQEVNKGGIRTFASANVPGHTYRSGSSSEFAAFALGLIDNQPGSKYGFYSWSQGNVVKPAGSIVPFDTLEFANTPQDGQLGFSTGGAPDTVMESCIKDYYSNVSGAVTAGDLNGKPAGAIGTSKIINKGTTPFSIGGPTWQFNPGERLTIYAGGDVYINTNIQYPGSVITPSYFTLIVKGNIYISSGVTKLEGFYIAQPDFVTAAKGNIWTCAVPVIGPAGTLGQPSSAQMISSCKNKLTINGAVMAKHVTFNRIGDLTANTLSAVKSSDPEVPGNNKAVEEINFIPEMVIGSPYLTTNNGSSSRLDAITVLPPLF